MGDVFGMTLTNHLEKTNVLKGTPAVPMICELKTSKMTEWIFSTINEALRKAELDIKISFLRVMLPQ